MKAFTIVPVRATVAAANEALGCYSTLVLGNTAMYEFNSYGSCRAQCSVSAHRYSALQGDWCTYVYELPPASALIVDEKCNTPYPGLSTASLTATHAVNNTTSTNTASNTAATTIPIAAAVTGNAHLGSIAAAAAMGLGVMANLF